MYRESYILQLIIISAISMFVTIFAAVISFSPDNTIQERADWLSVSGIGIIGLIYSLPKVKRLNI